MAEQLKPRSEISEDLKWDLTAIFKDETDFETTQADFLKKVEAFVEEYKGNLTNSETVVEALHKYEDLLSTSGYLGQYRSLPVNADATNGEDVSKLRAVGALLSRESAKLTAIVLLPSPASALVIKNVFRWYSCA